MKIEIRKFRENILSSFTFCIKNATDYFYMYNKNFEMELVK